MDDSSLIIVVILVLASPFLFILARHFFAPRRVVINLEAEIEQARQIMLADPANDPVLVNRMYAELWPDKYLRPAVDDELQDENGKSLDKPNGL